MSYERLALVCALVAVVAVGVVAIRLWNARRVARIRRLPPEWDVLGVRPDGRRTVVAFSTPSCAACHLAQSPALERARAELAGIDIRRIDVDTARHPEIARAFGIVTVPSTVVIAERGARIVAVNQGFTPSDRLVEQLQHDPLP
jgi:thiol-disulfide isomerase/thioredoxin